MGNESVMCLQVYAPEDVFSKIVNRHHDIVRAKEAKALADKQRRKAQNRVVATLTVAAVSLLLIGFMIGAKILTL
jgi:hypothetical protein